MGTSPLPSASATGRRRRTVLEDLATLMGRDEEKERKERRERDEERKGGRERMKREREGEKEVKKSRDRMGEQGDEEIIDN